MKDTIYRQDAIDALDGEIEITGRTNAETVKGYVRLVKDRLERLPSAQPEIIRCKDCKHQVKEWRTDKRLKNNGYMVCGCDVVGDACGYWALLGQDDDYCSMVERRTDD
ncbi:MAG: hypothetical protein UHS49_03300 [Faecalimonas sp.]|nr:hypothetical protein [Faecalimonas sp.]